MKKKWRSLKFWSWSKGITIVNNKSLDVKIKKSCEISKSIFQRQNNSLVKSIAVYLDVKTAVLSNQKQYILKSKPQSCQIDSSISCRQNCSLVKIVPLEQIFLTKSSIVCTSTHSAYCLLYRISGTVGTIDRGEGGIRLWFGQITCIHFKFVIDIQNKDTLNSYVH